jgi:hypothetical protein
MTAIDTLCENVTMAAIAESMARGWDAMTDNQEDQCRIIETADDNGFSPESAEPTR